MKKVYIIKGKDEQELADNINKFDKEIFATQPIQKKNGEFIAFVYVNEIGDKPIQPADGLATDKQKAFLKWNKIPFKENISKTEAFKIIQDMQK